MALVGAEAWKAAMGVVGTKEPYYHSLLTMSENRGPAPTMTYGTLPATTLISEPRHGIGHSQYPSATSQIGIGPWARGNNSFTFS